MDNYQQSNYLKPTNHKGVKMVPHRSQAQLPPAPSPNMMRLPQDQSMTIDQIENSPLNAAGQQHRTLFMGWSHEEDAELSRNNQHSFHANDSRQHLFENLGLQKIPSAAGRQNPSVYQNRLRTGHNHTREESLDHVEFDGPGISSPHHSQLPHQMTPNQIGSVLQTLELQSRGLKAQAKRRSDVLTFEDASAAVSQSFSQNDHDNRYRAKDLQRKSIMWQKQQATKVKKPSSHSLTSSFSFLSKVKERWSNFFKKSDGEEVVNMSQADKSSDSSSVDDDPERTNSAKKIRRKKSVLTKALEAKRSSGGGADSVVASPPFFGNSSGIDIMDLGKDVSSLRRDSLSQSGFHLSSFVIPSDHRAKYIWNFILAVVAVTDAFIFPMSLAFAQVEAPAFVEVSVYVIYGIDIFINSRTTMLHPETRELVRTPGEIFKKYCFSLGFLIDLLCVLPLHLLLPKTFIDIRVLRLLKVFRLNPELGIGHQSETVQLMLKIANIFFFLLLYIHLGSCYLFFVVDSEQVWVPAQGRFASGNEDFYQASTLTQYLTTVYMSIQILVGDDTGPETDWQLGVVCFFTLAGAFVLANIFGTIAVVVSSLNRHDQKLQDKINMANTSMTNIKLPSSIQEDIREFMLQTQNNLDTQKELDSFMQMISPSLRNKVTKHIFINAIASNPILQGSQEAIDFLINDVSTLLFMPEDRIVGQGEQGSSLYLIAQGDCQVWVNDHMMEQHYVRQLNQGEYFGEVSILFETPRTATVKSSNYCTLACLSKKTFFDLCHNFPEIIVRMRERTHDYDDPWKMFKKKVLNQVEYFGKIAKEKPFFLDEVQYHLEEEYYDKGTEIIGPDCSTKHITIIVQGVADLTYVNKKGQSAHIERLSQGDVIGQFSVLFDEVPQFSFSAESRVKVLTLSQEFFLENADLIKGLKKAVYLCEDAVEDHGIPMFDYRKYYAEDSILSKLLRTARKVKKMKEVFDFRELSKQPGSKGIQHQMKFVRRKSILRRKPSQFEVALMENPRLARHVSHTNGKKERRLSVFQKTKQKNRLTNSEVIGDHRALFDDQSSPADTRSKASKKLRIVKEMNSSNSSFERSHSSSSSSSYESSNSRSSEESISKTDSFKESESNGIRKKQPLIDINLVDDSKRCSVSETNLTQALKKKPHRDSQGVARSLSMKKSEPNTEGRKQEESRGTAGNDSDHLFVKSENGENGEYDSRSSPGKKSKGNRRLSIFSKKRPKRQESSQNSRSSESSHSRESSSSNSSSELRDHVAFARKSKTNQDLLGLHMNKHQVRAKALSEGKLIARRLSKRIVGPGPIIFQQH